MSDDSGEIRKYLHDAIGAVSVLEAFMKCLHPEEMCSDMKELHQAAENSVSRIRRAIKEAQKILNDA